MDVKGEYTSKCRSVNVTTMNRNESKLCRIEYNRIEYNLDSSESLSSIASQYQPARNRVTLSMRQTLLRLRQTADVSPLWQTLSLFNARVRNCLIFTSGLKSDVIIVITTLTPTNCFSLLEVVTALPLSAIKKCDRESAHRQTDTRTDRDKLTEFIICPMLYAICCMLYAMEQIFTLTTCYYSAASQYYVRRWTENVWNGMIMKMPINDSKGQNQSTLEESGDPDFIYMSNCGPEVKMKTGK